MKKIFENRKGVDLMIWETNPQKRNTNNEIKLVIDSNEEISEGDLIVSSFNDEGSFCSTYQVESVINKRKAALRKKEYITVKSKWTGKPLDFKKYDSSRTSSSFKKVFNINF